MKDYILTTPNDIEQNLINLKQLVFEVTDACNLRCKYCGYADLYEGYDKRENTYFPFKLAKLIIDYLYNKVNALYEWERNFLPTAPIDGRIAFMQLWKKGQYVGADETMLVVVPDGKSEFVGKALLPMQGSGKVKAGQRAIIRLTGFPEQEYKGLKGKVVSISPVPDEKGNYIMEIQLTEMPEKLPPTMKVMSGTAEIIICEQSLLKRILNP